ncbi:hypothetical protein D3H65_06870 [Paraflavitalea soli]|uniref:Uncharacterized protein n=1 Tax=Paraflavitalea soli TaxID=2315862 RepID=A0A3B7ML26_9BACT|nr:hypothetical protein [Paraflavitalea soli]AXY73716.1 hypothetical protein D3H65_06870 [Paraflavitalea soli]
MPLQTIELPAKLNLRIARRVSALVRQGILSPGPDPITEHQVSFCMAIQLVPKLTGNRFSFGKAEGLRVFISTGKKIIAAVDFLYAGKIVRLSHIYQGPPLDQLVRTLDRLKTLFAAKPNTYHAEVLSFLFAQSILILVRSGKNRSFYRSNGTKVDELTMAALKQEIEDIISIQPLPEEL